MPGAVRLPVDTVPEVARDPVQLPEAVQLVLWVVDQLTFAAVAWATTDGLAFKVTVGASGGASTVTVTVRAVPTPPAEQVSVKFVSAVRGPVPAVPASGLLPLQPPEAVQVLALPAVQLRVELAPVATLVGFAVNVSVGGGGVTVTVVVWLAVTPAPVQFKV